MRQPNATSIRVVQFLRRRLHVASCLPYAWLETACAFLRDTAPGQNRREEPTPHRPAWQMVPVCGLQAVRTVFRHKPAIVERLFFDAATGRELGDESSYMAKQRKAYRQVTREELARIADTKLHGGVVAITKRRPLEPATAKLAEYWGKEKQPVLILEGLTQPSNLAEIARAATHFGLSKAVVADSAEQARPGKSAYRLARGALDMLDIRLAEDLPKFLRALRESHLIVGYADDGVALKNALGAIEKQTGGKSLAIVFGNEEKGLSEPVRKLCASLARVSGDEASPGISVAAAASIALHGLLAQ